MKLVEYGTEHREVIILLHGGGLSWWNYQEAASVLASQYHVVLPILDGHTGSDAPFTTLEENAASVISYIDTYWGGQVLLLGGVSLGAQVVLEILSQRSETCRYAIIESALAIPMRFTASLLKPACQLCYPWIQTRWFSRLQFLALHIKPEWFATYYADTCSIHKTDLISFLQANAAYRPKVSLANCRAKVLLLVGDKEPHRMKRSAQYIASLLPNNRLVLLPKCHHGTFSLNHAKRYAQQLLHWIEQSPT